ncbi:MAG: 1-deoxy-D-xylulose-5-phosphate reductoisomerase [Clostridiales bacterium]|nr:1-deoxy-D-xylulose-5-phosphate reductoisomerase [Clostridiales bacterium]
MSKIISIKNISVIGCSGSIGKQCADIVRLYPERFSLRAVAANKDVCEAVRQANEFGVKYVAFSDTSVADEYNLSGCKAELLLGEEGILKICEDPESDIIVMSVSGFAGIKYTLHALKCGKRVAVATKEVLVSAGAIIKQYIALYGGSIVPIDSEHSAVMQCIEAGGRENVNKIILTASGGPFRKMCLEDLYKVTPKDALAHPTWNMGKKITIDSATLMNKGLEVIEASVLFDCDADDIQVAVHPQSIIHSMVEFKDGSTVALLDNADMRNPILYALSYPEREIRKTPPFDIFSLPPLTFERPDFSRFKCLSLAYDVLNKGGIYPCVMNAANEKAVELFLNEKIGFMDIYDFVSKRVEETANISEPTLLDIIEADRYARR